MTVKEYKKTIKDLCNLVIKNGEGHQSLVDEAKLIKRFYSTYNKEELEETYNCIIKIKDMIF